MIFEYLKKPLVVFALLFCAFTSPTLLHAQISIGGKPYSFTHQLNEKSLPAARMPKVDLAKLRAEDATESRDGSTPCWRFAVPHSVRLNLQNAGHWQTLPGGDRLWRLQIDCPDAISVNLLYDDFYLPKGATLHLYRPDGQQLRGAFTSRNNTADRKFATAIITGESVVLEYYEPLAVKGQGAISIDRVNHGYRGYGENNIDLGASGDCQVNINCPEGDAWQTIKRSVAKYTVNGNAWCSGTLVTNPAQDCRRLFLTAKYFREAARKYCQKQNARSCPGVFCQKARYGKVRSLRELGRRCAAKNTWAANCRCDIFDLLFAGVRWSRQPA